MNLVVDIGNTKTKLALFDEKELKELAIFFNEESEKLLEFFASKQIAESVIAATGEVDEQIKGYLINHTLFKQFRNLELPFSLDYETPKTLGEDRIAAVCGAKSLLNQQNLLIITAGTCITYNFLDENGIFKGGGISPGIYMRYQAMNYFTSKLPLVENKEFEELIGRSTEESLQSGVRQGILAEVDGIIDQYQLLYPNLGVFICGGDTNFFERRLKNEIFAHPNLVLYGMNELLIYNSTN